MTIKNYKPITPSLRHRIIVKKPSFLLNKEEEKREKYLIKGYKPSGGRNNQGRITSSNRGGKSKNKKNLRVIDYTRELGNYSKCEVKRIENNPYGSAWIANIKIKNIINDEMLNKETFKNKFKNKKIYDIIESVRKKENYKKKTKYDYWSNKFWNNINKDFSYYILAPNSLKEGDIIYGSKYKYTNINDNEKEKINTFNNIGNNIPLYDLPIGSNIFNVKKNKDVWNEYNYSNNENLKKETFNIEKWISNLHINNKNMYKLKLELDNNLRFYKYTNLYNKNNQYFINKGLFARSAGSFCIILKTIDNTNDLSINNNDKLISDITGNKGNKRTIIRLPSKKILSISADCFASVGISSNPQHELIVKGKAGVNRWLGKRPHVRGEAQNAVDHPHGGKNHGSGGLGNPPKTKYGKLAKWQKKK